MSDNKHLDNVIRFPTESVKRFGFERVRKRRPARESRMEDAGQLSLFNKPARDAARGEIVQLPSSMGLFDEALLLDDEGNEKAVEAYRRAIEAGDSVPDAYCNLGVIETMRGHRDEAFECFTSALKQDPQHFESHYNIANLYFEDGDMRPARLHYGVAAEIDPDFPNTYFNLAVVYAMNLELEDAVSTLLRYRELAPPEEATKADELLACLRQTLDHQS